MRSDAVAIAAAVLLLSCAAAVKPPGKGPGKGPPGWGGGGGGGPPQGADCPHWCGSKGPEPAGDCDMPACKDCAECVVADNKTICADWCGADTCQKPSCQGCDQCECDLSTMPPPGKGGPNRKWPPSGKDFIDRLKGGFHKHNLSDVRTILAERHKPPKWGKGKGGKGKGGEEEEVEEADDVADLDPEDIKTLFEMLKNYSLAYGEDEEVAREALSVMGGMRNEGVISARKKLHGPERREFETKISDAAKVCRETFAKGKLREGAPGFQDMLEEGGLKISVRKTWRHDLDKSDTTIRLDDSENATRFKLPRGLAHRLPSLAGIVVWESRDPPWAEDNVSVVSVVSGLAFVDDGEPLALSNLTSDEEITITFCVDLAYAGTKLSCRFWDIEGAEWSAKGVKTKWPKDLDGCVECKATHLTEFAIVDAKEDWDWGSEKGDWGSKADDWGSKEGDWGSKDDSGPKLAPFQPPPPSPAADFDPVFCCLAMTASCLACASGVSVGEYCQDHPDTVGCPSPRPKILCLHGGGGSAANFQLQAGMAAIAADLESEFDFVFVNAPQDGTWIPDAPDGKTFSSESGEWTIGTTSDPNWASASVSLIDQVVDSQGPFAGLLGYSQGAAFALFYLSQAPQETFRFVALFCGYEPTNHLGLMESVDAQGAPYGWTPALIFMGEGDTIITNEMSRAAAANFNYPTVVVSEIAGHHLPIPSDETYSTVVSFLRSLQCPPVCEIFCEHGNVLDSNGCPLCDCQPEPRLCCRAMTAECMACVEGVTQAEYCGRHPDTVGCKPVPADSCAVDRDCCEVNEGATCTTPRGGGPKQCVMPNDALGRTVQECCESDVCCFWDAGPGQGACACMACMQPGKDFCGDGETLVSVEGACCEWDCANPSNEPRTTTSGEAKEDPHLFLAHGGRADFRGRHGVLYNFFSAPGLAVNVKTENATFTLHDGRLTVHGSFLTEMHLVARVGGYKRKWANASFWASELNRDNWGWRIVSGTCGGHAFKLGRGGFRKCEELEMEVRMSSATFEVGNWTFTALGNHVYNRLYGPHHRLDLELNAKGDAAARYSPHGIIGQSFAHREPRNGSVDHYPDAGDFTTSAMAEGAIEGEASAYEVATAHATHFAFSRFDSNVQAVYPESQRAGEIIDAAAAE